MGRQKVLFHRELSDRHSIFGSLGFASEPNDELRLCDGDRSNTAAECGRRCWWLMLIGREERRRPPDEPAGLPALNRLPEVPRSSQEPILKVATFSKKPILPFFHLG